MRTVQIGHVYQTMFCLNDAFEAVLDHYPELQDVIAFCRSEVAEIEDSVNDAYLGAESDAVYSTQENYEAILHDVLELAEIAIEDYATMKRPPQGARKMHDRLQLIISHCLANT